MRLFKSSPAGAIVLCLIGGVLVFVTSGRVWARAGVHFANGIGGSTSLTITGHDASSSIPATGIALMALALAILAGSGVLRRMVGAVTALVGIGAIGAALYGRGNVSNALTSKLSEHSSVTGISVQASANGWWVVALVGALLAVAAGLVTVRFAPGWSQMAERYDAPDAAKPKRDPAAVAWDALDRGEDPTD
jgi:uncharacterized membrane protein (TIGR02234 family)